MGDCPHGSLHVTCHPEGWECVETEGSPRWGVTGASAATGILGQSSQPRRPQNQDGDRCGHVGPIPAPHINATMVGYRVEGTQACESTQALPSLRQV